MNFGINAGGWVFFAGCLSIAALGFAAAKQVSRSGSSLYPVTGLTIAVVALLSASPPSLIVDGNGLLGAGGVVLATGMTRSDRHQRAIGGGLVGIGVISIGVAAALFGLDFLGAGGRLFGGAVAIHGIGIVAFSGGVLADSDRGRTLANVGIGAGAAGVGIAILVAIEPEQIAKLGQAVLAVGVAVFGIGIIGVSAGLLTNHARSADWSMLITGAGGLIAGAGAVVFGVKTLGHDDSLGGMASVLAGVAAIAFGISGVMFGGGRLMNHPSIDQRANQVFGWAGIGGGLGGLLSGVAIAVSRADRVLSETDEEVLFTTARAVASLGVAAAGYASIALGRRDLGRTAESFQITPDALRRRGVRPPL